MLTRIDHIGIACFDLDRTIDFYRATYGFEVFHTEINEEQGVREAMLRINGTSDGGASYLQLLEPVRADSAVGTWLARHGEGVHHIAFGTADVDADAEAIRGTGVRVLYDEPRRGSMDSRITFLHPKDCHGVLTELVTAAAHPNDPDHTDRSEHRDGPLGEQQGEHRSEQQDPRRSEGHGRRNARTDATSRGAFEGEGASTEPDH